MKIGYLSHFSDGTGYAYAAINSVLAMNSIGLDVVPIEIKLASQNVEPPKLITDLKKKDTNNLTHLIQHTLPGYFVYTGKVKNIGYFHVETTHFRPSRWQFNMNLMDHLLVSCKENLNSAKESGVNKPISIVPIPLDKTQYNKEQYKNILKLPIGNRFAFYSIADYSTRKNLHNLIKAYFLSFTKADNVVLVLKTYIEGTTAEQSKQILQQEIQNIKISLRKGVIDNYPPIILITDYLTENQIKSLHSQCHCFVSMERGAAWNIPSFDAAGFGNWCIVNKWGGQNQFIEDGKNGFLLDYQMVPVEGMINTPHPYIYTCFEQWADVNILDMSKNMLKVYMSPEFKIKEKNRLEYLDKWDYNNCGQIFKDIINALDS